MGNKPRYSWFNNSIATPEDSFRDDFKSIFWVDVTKFNDMMVSATQDSFKFHMVLFVEHLVKKHGDFLEKKIRPDELVRQHYGNKGVAMIDYLIEGKYEKPFTFTDIKVVKN